MVSRWINDFGQGVLGLDLLPDTIGVANGSTIVPLD